MHNTYNDKLNMVEIPLEKLKQKSPSIDDAASIYACNSSTYASVASAGLTSNKLLDYITQYNKNEITIYGICNTEKIKIRAFRMAVKAIHFGWDVSLKHYVPKSEIKQTKKVRVSRVPVTRVKLDPTVYRMLLLQAAMEKMEINQLLNLLIERSVTVDVRKLALSGIPLEKRMLS